MIALIAHDQKKPEMLEFARQYRSFLEQQDLVATGHTGQMLTQELGLSIEQVASGPEGGDLIIGGRVAVGEIECVMFFRDPLTAQPHEPDISALMRVCDVHKIPLATNKATAIALIEGLRLS